MMATTFLSSGHGVHLVRVIHKVSLVAQMVKNPPAVRTTWVQSLGQEDLLEKGMAPHSIIVAWQIPWTKEPGRIQSMGSQRVRHNISTKQNISSKN